ncbi:hypothetical protein CBR_g38045 [Chara braunii]|uniref:Suppressor of white apricot N-terminal domain-containing protein n=1 Tax=Chara braunii TaxID=69332 RepID=A0A388K077_CHABU|nr:hypothetical protein CBR_g38045 [Chara braunii]|eukprot:GBG63425.1 hypothetical protein CBR_g38045 [Chara braunii]
MDRRLDYFLVSAAASSEVMRVVTANESFSDHKSVVMDCAITAMEERGPGYFRLNTTLLEDEGLILWVSDFWNNWKEVKTHTSGMGGCRYAVDYFEDIMTTRRPCDTMEDDMSLLSPLWNNFTVRLTADGRLWLDRPVSEEKLAETIKVMARGKAPGDDGLPIKFFASCWDSLAGDLTEMFNEVLNGGRLGKSITRGIISLLFKKGDRCEVRNWRSISLVNVVYKLLARTLASRLSKFLPGLVQRDQGAFVQGRSIFENVVTTIEALKLVDREDEETAVLLLYLEKAYDRVNWTFVITTLKVAGFGEAFCRWGKVLYLFSSAAVCVNGVISNEFKLSRVKALADDLFAISVNERPSLEVLKGCLVDFGELSEAAVNWNKSTFFLPKQFPMAVQWGMERIHAEAAERFLGVQIGLADCSSAQEPPRQKTEEEEELEELVNFERFRDLIKHRRRGLSDEEGLEDIEQVLEARATAPPANERQRVQPAPAAPARAGAYAQVAFSYQDPDGLVDGGEDGEESGEEDEEEEEESSSEDSEDEDIEQIARNHGVDDYNRLVRLDKKARDEQRRQKEAAKGERKLTRKERRRAAREERERDRDAAWLTCNKLSSREPVSHERRASPSYDAYPHGRRGRSRSASPARWRRHERDRDRDRDWDRDRDRERDRERGRERTRERERESSRARNSPPKKEYITEFGGPISGEEDGRRSGVNTAIGQGIAPPPSPPSCHLQRGNEQQNLNRPWTGQILEALRSDPAVAGVSAVGVTPAAVPAVPKDKERRLSDSRLPATGSRDGLSAAALAKLSKGPPAALAKPAQQQGLPQPTLEKKAETPQERLKRIMSKQLNKQIKKDTASELAKKREQEKQRLEKLAETRRAARLAWSSSRSRRGGEQEVQVPEDIIVQGPDQGHLFPGFVVAGDHVHLGATEDQEAEAGAGASYKNTQSFAVYIFRACDLR